MKKWMGLSGIYYLSMIQGSYWLLVDEVKAKSQLPVLLFKERASVYRHDEDGGYIQRDNPIKRTALRAAQDECDQLYADAFEWCKKNCGLDGFAPVLTGFNDYVRRREEDTSVIRGFMFDTEELAVQFRLVFDVEYG